MRFNRLFFKTKSIEDRKYIRYVYFKKLLMKHLIFSFNFKYTPNDIKSLRMSRNLKTKISIKFKDGVKITLCTRKRRKK